MVVDMASGRTEDLFPEARNPEGIYHINERCLLRTQEGHCVVIVSGMVLAHYATSDKMAEALAGSWICSSAKARTHLGWYPAAALVERLHETAQWYRQAGWL